MKRGQETDRQTDTHRDSMKESSKGLFFENKNLSKYQKEKQQ